MKHPATLAPALFTALASLLLTLSGCEKAAPAPPPKPEVELVPTSERSKHFEAVTRQLDLGGTFFAYMDTDGDAAMFADQLQAALASVPDAPPELATFLKEGFPALFTTLGLNDIKAAGLSSARDGTDGGYNNRMFLYTPDGRHGLLAGFGGPAAEFTNARLAPADADFYYETEFDLPPMYDVAKKVANQIGGGEAEDQMNQLLEEGGKEAGFSAMDLIQSLKGRIVMLARFDDKNTVTLPTPTPLVIPAYSLLIRVDGLGKALEQLLDKQTDTFNMKTDGTMKVYALKTILPVEGLRPAMGIEGGALYLAGNPEFLVECSKRKAGLDQDATFQQAVAALGGKGNSLAYLSPRLFDKARQLPALNPKLDPASKDQLTKTLQQLPTNQRPMISLAANLPDGVLVRSSTGHSFKQALVLGPLVMAGVVAAMAIPAFEKVRDLTGAGPADPSQLPPSSAGPNDFQFQINPPNTGSGPLPPPATGKAP